mmetsp:Transcript_97631/g.244670  ORF Transcript_97631/g.244670 Transcript_97631/m.244670 type:complete len:259 (+) Transcript_97631:182-958(+)
MRSSAWWRVGRRGLLNCGSETCLLMALVFSSLGRTGLSSMAGSPSGKGRSRCWAAPARCCCHSTAKPRNLQRSSPFELLATASRTLTTRGEALAVGVIMQNLARGPWVSSTVPPTHPGAWPKMWLSKFRRYPRRQSGLHSCDTHTSYTARRSGPCGGCTIHAAADFVRGEPRTLLGTSRTIQAAGPPQLWILKPSAACSRLQTLVGTAIGSPLQCHRARMSSWSWCQAGLCTKSWDGPQNLERTHPSAQRRRPPLHGS